MTSFVTTTNLTTNQSLATGEYGVVTAGFGVYPAAGIAVNMAGSAKLSVMGSVISQSSAGVGLNNVSGGHLSIAASGVVMGPAAAGSGVGGSITGSFAISNAGQIMAGTGVYLNLTQAASYATLSNSGLIAGMSTGLNTGAVFVATVTGAKFFLDNAGTIQGTGTTHGVFVGGTGTAEISNAGVISTATVDNRSAIDLEVAAVLRNTGTIIGDITSDAALTLRSSGTINGHMALGAFNDVVRVSGLVDGDIYMGTGNNTFVQSGGRVTGTVTGGSANDFFEITQAGIQLADLGGAFDTVRTHVDYVNFAGIEVVELRGAAGLRATGSAASEQIYGSAGDDTIRGEEGADNLVGGRGNDLIFGGTENDSLEGGTGDDLMRGGNGDDQFTAYAGADTMDGGLGTDVIDMAFVFDPTLQVSVNLATGQARFETGSLVRVLGVENVIGSTQNDQLTGDAAANSLGGRAGDDTILGGGGADTLQGNSGADELGGGAGADVFVYASTTESNGFEGQDLITGFVKADDVIDLSGIDAVAGGADDSFVFVGTAAFNGSGPQVRIVVDALAQTTTVEVRLNGSVGTDMTIVLDNDLALTASNFLL